ncbi:MAG: Gfo/Idh/MocA family protein [Planctomycetota bacterium]
MSTGRSLNFGIVGACGRGASFRQPFDVLEGISLHAVCDINEDELAETRDKLGADAAYVDYDELLDDRNVDVVIVGTPMPLHVPMCVAALEAGKHVISEVPAAVSVEEARHLVETVRRSPGTYIMAENCNYLKPVVMVDQMVRRGLFGSPYYAEAEYVHELKDLNEQTPWRKRWQGGVRGITYGTHSLGPVLKWMRGDRVVEVCCAGSGARHTEADGTPYVTDSSTVMFCRMGGGGLVVIRCDMLSNRPHVMNGYQLQGMTGCYESSRSGGCPERVYLQDRCERDRWLTMEELEEEFLDEDWRRWGTEAERSGHHGADFIQMVDFVEVLKGNRPNPLDIDAAMDITLPGLIGQRSIVEGSRWVEVPDSRTWP